MSNGHADQGAPGRARQHAQDRAQRAWAWVEAVRRERRDVQQRYGTLARKLPGYIQASGLGQTMAFLLARRGEPREHDERGESRETTAEGLLFDHLDRHLRDILRRQRASSRNPMALILELTPAEYRRATRELMALASWLKRFAEGRLELGQGGP